MLASLRQKALRCMTTLPTNQMLCRTKWTEITPENKEVARRRILQKFIDAEIDFEDPDNALLVPHMGVLEERNSMMPENNAPGLEETDENELEFEMRKMGVESQVIAIDRVQKPTTLGNILQFRACVVAGNTRGVAGYAICKASNVNDAVDRATRRAFQTMVHIDRFDKRTLYHEVNGKFNSATVSIRPTGCGRGTRSGDVVGAILYCFGIEDVTAKCHGQRNPFTVVKAAFDALAQHQSAEEIAMRTGRSIAQIKKVAYNRRF